MGTAEHIVVDAVLRSTVCRGYDKVMNKVAWGSICYFLFLFFLKQISLMLSKCSMCLIISMGFKIIAVG